MNVRDAWPPVALLLVANEPAPTWGLRELTPVFDRVPYGDWCVYFDAACEADPDINWLEAGFARCGESDVDRVISKFAVATQTANASFVDFLERASEVQPDAVADLVALEGSLAAAGADGGRCL